MCRVVFFFSFAGVCGFMGFKEHQFKTNSLQRRQSPLHRHWITTKNIFSLQSFAAVQVPLPVSGGPSRDFKIWRVKFIILLLSQLRHTAHGLRLAMLEVMWQTVSESNTKVGRWGGGGGWGLLCIRTFLSSHGSVLLPRFVGCRTGGRAQGGSQGAEKAGQQRETEAPPGTKHGPAIAMANVFGEAVHGAWEARQLKVDPCHARAQGDDATRSCVRGESSRALQGSTVKLLHGLNTSLQDQRHVTARHWFAILCSI